MRGSPYLADPSSVAAPESSLVSLAPRHANGHRAQKLDLADLDVEAQLELVFVACGWDET